MLASWFVVQGVNAIRKPERLVMEAEPIVAVVVPPLRAVLPATLSDAIPSDTASLVRIQGVAQVLSGIALATGIGRRIGAGILSLTVVPQLLAAAPARHETSQTRDSFFARIALLGGVLLASQDTEGQPTLLWRARLEKEILAKEAERTKSELGRQTRKLTRGARHTAIQISRNVGDVLS